MARVGVLCLPLGRLEDAEPSGLIRCLESHDWVVSGIVEPSGKEGEAFVRFHCPRCGVDFGLFYSEGTQARARVPFTRGDTR